MRLHHHHRDQDLRSLRSRNKDAKSLPDQDLSSRRSANRDAASLRDADYRGQPTTIDWSRLVHNTRLNKPGALEVLQDAILTWFPEQFKVAQKHAKHIASNFPKHVYGTIVVGFMADVARQRFKAPHPRPPTLSPSSNLVVRLDTIEYVVSVYHTNNPRLNHLSKSSSSET